MIIGLTGYARSGKDTVADILVAEHGFTRVALADGVRELALRIDPVLGLNMHKRPYTLSQAVHTFGWEALKSTCWGPEVRRLLQEIGTGCRDLLGENVWIDRLWLRHWPDASRVVITDVRFANEAFAVRREFGEVWRVERPGVAAYNEHASERLEFDADLRIWNDRDIAGLQQEVASVIGRYRA